jgi:hypothetical protein
MNYLTTSKIVSYLAIIFLAGGATGAVVGLNHSRERQVQPASMQKVCTRLQDRLISKLGLTPEQVKKLQPVFDQTAHELRAVHAKALGETDQIITRAHEQIARELTEEQKARLVEFDQQRREWLRHRLQDCDRPKSETSTVIHP